MQTNIPVRENCPACGAAALKLHEHWKGRRTVLEDGTNGPFSSNCPFLQKEENKALHSDLVQQLNQTGPKLVMPGLRTRIQAAYFAQTGNNQPASHTGNDGESAEENSSDKEVDSEDGGDDEDSDDDGVGVEGDGGDGDNDPVGERLAYYKACVGRVHIERASLHELIAALKTVGKRKRFLELKYAHGQAYIKYFVDRTGENMELSTIKHMLDTSAALQVLSECMAEGTVLERPYSPTEELLNQKFKALKFKA